MYRALFLLTVFLWSIVSFAQEKRSTFIKDQPLPMKVVNDFGKFLTKPEKDHLEKVLIAFRERKDYSIVIITLPGLIDNKGIEFTIEEAAQLYFNKWGIGDNVKNDGVLILLSKKPRRIRIHTGSGMATLLTNANCASIINGTMVPNFKADLYFTGLKDAVRDIETYINDNEAANGTQAVANTSTTSTAPTQQAVTSQGAVQPQEEMTFGKFMYGFITIVTLVWLFFRYRLKKASLRRSGVYSNGGYNNSDVVVNNVNRISNNNWGGGSGRKRSWFNSGESGNSGWFSGGGGYSSGSSGSNSDSSGSGSSRSKRSSGSSGSSDDSSSSSSSGSYGGASGSW
jgi:uncharacterized protein